MIEKKEKNIVMGLERNIGKLVKIEDEEMRILKREEIELEKVNISEEKIYLNELRSDSRRVKS